VLLWKLPAYWLLLTKCGVSKKSGCGSYYRTRMELVKRIFIIYKKNKIVGKSVGGEDEGGIIE